MVRINEVRTASRFEFSRHRLGLGSILFLISSIRFSGFRLLPISRTVPIFLVVTGSIPSTHLGRRAGESAISCRPEAFLNSWRTGFLSQQNPNPLQFVSLHRKEFRCTCYV